jgi:hypothetical protein
MGSVADAGQVSCPSVIRELSRVSKREENRALAMEKVAKRLDTPAVWVVNCMRVYGRTVPRQIRIDPELREELLERMEERDLQSEDQAPEELRNPDPRGEPEPESAGNKKRKPNEYIRRYQYLPK